MQKWTALEFVRPEEETTSATHSLNKPDSILIEHKAIAMAAREIAETALVDNWITPYASIVFFPLQDFEVLLELLFFLEAIKLGVKHLNPI